MMILAWLVRTQKESLANYLNNEFISSVSIHDSCPIVWNFYWCDSRFCLNRKGLKFLGKAPDSLSNIVASILLVCFNTTFCN